LLYFCSPIFYIHPADLHWHENIKTILTVSNENGSTQSAQVSLRVYLVNCTPAAYYFKEYLGDDTNCVGTTCIWYCGDEDVKKWAENWTGYRLEECTEQEFYDGCP
jgi:hypothetical protein